MVIYSHEGAILQAFDYSDQPQLQQFTNAAACPVSESFVLGSSDHLHAFSLAPASQQWSASDTHVNPLSACPAHVAQSWVPVISPTFRPTSPRRLGELEDDIRVLQCTSQHEIVYSVI